MIPLVLLVNGQYRKMIIDLFTIRQVQCQTDGSSCSPDVIAELERNIGTFSLIVRPRVLEERLVLADGNLAHARVTIQLPSTLLATVSARKPVAQLGGNQHPRTVFLVDEEGIVLSQRPYSESLPLLIWDLVGQVAVGEQVPDSITQAVALTRELQSMVTLASSPKVESRSLVASVSDGPAVWFSLENDGRAQLSALQLLLDQARIGGTKYTKIDLRFGRPIVTQ